MWAAALFMLQTMGVAAAQTGGATQDPAATALLIDVAGHLYGANGPSVSSAGNSGLDSVSGYIWSDDALCSTNASGREMSFTPAVGWHYTARLLQRTGDEFTVQVSWQRLWEKSTRPAVPRSGDVQVKLRQGDWLELDRVDATTLGICQATSLRLEVSIRFRSVVRGMSMPPGGAVATGSVGAGAGGAGSGGAGGGTYRPGGGVVGTGPVSSGGGRGGGGGGTSVLRGGGAGARPVEPLLTPSAPAASPTVQSDEDLRLRVMALLLALRAQIDRTNVDASVTARVEELRQIVSQPRYDAEVWLVHRSPNGTEDVQRQAARFASRASIAFATVPIATARGPVNIEVTAILQIAPGAAQPLQVRISRRIKADGAPPLDNYGGSSRVMDIPKPDEVLSFELPTLVGPTSDLLAGHSFSLRLRIGPEVAPSAGR